MIVLLVLKNMISRISRYKVFILHKYLLFSYNIPIGQSVTYILYFLSIQFKSQYSHTFGFLFTITLFIQRNINMKSVQKNVYESELTETTIDLHIISVGATSKAFPVRIREF